MNGARSDRELWDLALGHDGVAFGQLFDRHEKVVYNHCFRRTASWSEAEDLASIVWAQAWRRRKDVRFHDDSILPWLLTIANYCSRNLRRSQRRYRNLLAKLPPALSSDFTEDTASRLDDERLMAAVLAALAELRIVDQEVVALCDWAGMSYAEVSSALGIPVGTVRSRLSRAHNRLRKSIVTSPSGQAEMNTRSLRPHQQIQGEPR